MYKAATHCESVSDFLRLPLFPFPASGQQCSCLRLLTTVHNMLITVYFMSYWVGEMRPFDCRFPYSHRR